MKEKKLFRIWNEKGICLYSYAYDKEDAENAYYDSMKSIIGHELRVCSCFGDKPLDRSKVIGIWKIEEPIESDEQC